MTGNAFKFSKVISNDFFTMMEIWVPNFRDIAVFWENIVLELGRGDKIQGYRNTSVDLNFDQSETNNANLRQTLW